MSRVRRRRAMKREGRVVYAVTDPGSAGPPLHEPQTHYVGSLERAKRLADHFTRLRKGEREPTIVRIKVPKMTPRKALVWALNFADHAGHNNLPVGVTAYCDEIDTLTLDD